MGCGGSKEPPAASGDDNQPHANPQPNTSRAPKQPKTATVSDVSIRAAPASAEPKKYKPPPGFPTPKLLEQSQRDYAQNNEYDSDEDGKDDSGKPTPKPPKQSKADVFDRDEYADVRRRAMYEDGNLGLSAAWDVSQRLCSYSDDDVGQLYAIFCWVLHCAKNLSEFDLDEVPPSDSVLYQLILAHAGFTSFNTVFKTLCSQAGFEARIVTGNVKTVYDTDHVVGETGSWVTVLLHNEWFLVDVHFAIRSSHRRDLLVQEGNNSRQNNSKDQDEYAAADFYFLAEPWAFIFTHFTDDQKWQLLARPVTFEEFKAMAHLTEFYFLLDFMDVEKANGVLMTDSGQVTIKLRTAPRRNIKLTYNMSKLAGKEILSSVNGVNLKELVTVTSGDNKKTIDIDFLHIGRYSLKVWAVDMKNDPKTRKLIAQWFIQVNKPTFMWEPKPANPLVEFGPSAEAELSGLKIQSEVLTEGLLHIKFESERRSFDFQHKLECSDFARMKMKSNFRHYSINNEAGIVIKFPKHGKYLLQTLIKDLGSKKSFNQICSLILQSRVAYNDPTPFPPSTNGRIGYIPEGERSKIIPVTHPVPFFKVDEDEEKVEIVMRSSVHFDIMTRMENQRPSSKTAEDITSYLWLHVGLERDYLKYTFTARLPRAGMYHVTIFCRHKGDKGVFRELYKYIFIVDEPKHCHPFPGCHESWVPDYKIQNPTNGFLKEHTHENLTVDIANATEVVVFHSGSPKYQNLEFGRGGRFSGQIETLTGGSTLTIAARFPSEKNIKNLLHYEVLTDEDWNELSDYDNDSAADAKQRLKDLNANKEKEEADAVRREKERENEMQQRELQWLQFRDEYFEEEIRLQEEFEDQFKEKEEAKDEKLKKVLSHDEKNDIVRKEMKLILEEQDEEIRRRRMMYKELSENLDRQRLRQAIRLRNKTQLEVAIKESKGHGSTQKNNQDLKKAERLLDVINTKKELKVATKEKDVDTILLLIDEIMAKRYHGEMQYEVSEGESVVGAITRLERLRAFILAMEKNTMSEIRSYQKPPTVVHQVMQAIFLLLGEDEYSTSAWTDCAAKANPYGVNGLYRRIQKFEMDDVHPEIRERAREILLSMEFKKVRNVSTGAATFYVWALGLLEEHDKKNEGNATSRSTKSADDVIPANIERQREIFGRSSLGPDVPEYEYGRHLQRKSRDSMDTFRF